MALKLSDNYGQIKERFGGILNNMALKPFRHLNSASVGFGGILNNMALKPHMSSFF